MRAEDFAAFFAAREKSLLERDGQGQQQDVAPPPAELDSALFLQFRARVIVFILLELVHWLLSPADRARPHLYVANGSFIVAWQSGLRSNSDESGADATQASLGNRAGLDSFLARRGHSPGTEDSMADWIIAGKGMSTHADVRDALAEQGAARDGGMTLDIDWHRAVRAGLDVARWRSEGCWCVPVDGPAERELRADPAIVDYAEYVPLVEPA